MIVYSNNLKGFKQDVDSNQISSIVERNVRRCRIATGTSELGSWANSLTAMEKRVEKADIPDNCGVLVEYLLPSVNKRIDFILTGHDTQNKKNLLVVELKQWQKVRQTEVPTVFETYTGGGNREVDHPSAQAHGYMTWLAEMNTGIRENNIFVSSCAYMHNYKRYNEDPLKNKIFNQLISETPLFYNELDDNSKLESFINSRVGLGNGEKIGKMVENGKIAPSKYLMDHVDKLFKDNHNFIMLDEQKIAFDKIMHYALLADKKRTIIVKGGPGTGKSVISVNVFGKLFSAERNAIFIAPNAAFREVILQMLMNNKVENKTVLKSLFTGPASYYSKSLNELDAIVVDEAHRLIGKNDYKHLYKGKNQIEDIIKCSKTNVFFIDDTQQIKPDDIGNTKEVKRVAQEYNSQVIELELSTQFRCAGADGFINWIDSVLGIRETANWNGWDPDTFEFKIFDDPNEMHELIKKKDTEGFKSRLLAGYAWKWTKEDNLNSEIKDVSIPEHGFSMPWNSRTYGTKWSVRKDGIKQVGCIHTSQGLEFDYVGVIIGNDLTYNEKDGQISVVYSEYKDVAGKYGLKNEPERLKSYIKNIYKILMSRAMKGCYIYCRNAELQEYFKKQLCMVTGKEYERAVQPAAQKNIFEILSKIKKTQKFKTFLPVYSLKAACGKFGEGTDAEQEGWIKVDKKTKLNRNMFVSRVHGRSMEPMINDGDYCIFRGNVVGSRQNKIVLVQHNSISDKDTGGKYTGKKYTSKKTYKPDETWSHDKIVLLPMNQAYDPIEISNEEEDGFMVVAEFVKTI